MSGTEGQINAEFPGDVVRLETNVWRSVGTPHEYPLAGDPQYIHTSAGIGGSSFQIVLKGYDINGKVILEKYSQPFIIYVNWSYRMGADELWQPSCIESGVFMSGSKFHDFNASLDQITWLITPDVLANTPQDIRGVVIPWMNANLDINNFLVPLEAAYVAHFAKGVRLVGHIFERSHISYECVNPFEGGTVNSQVTCGNLRYLSRESAPQ